MHLILEIFILINLNTLKMLRDGHQYSYGLSFRNKNFGVVNQNVEKKGYLSEK